MIVLVNKNNTEKKQVFVIPKNGKIECNEWIRIMIDFDKEEFFARKVHNNDFLDEEWLIKDNLTFPSSLFTHFILNNPLEVQP